MHYSFCSKTQLVENLLRTDLQPIEEARAYQALMDLNGWNGRQVAEALRVTTSRVSRALALLDLPESVRRQVKTGTLPKSSAYEISKLADDRAQIELAVQAAAGDLSHAKAVNQINQRRGRKASKSRQGLHQVFYAESGFTVTVAARTRANYHEVEQALLDAVDEVRHRINNGATLF